MRDKIENSKFWKKDRVELQKMFKKYDGRAITISLWKIGKLKFFLCEGSSLSIFKTSE